MQELGLFLSLAMTFFVEYSSSTVQQPLWLALCLSDSHFKSVDSFVDLEKFSVLNRFIASSTELLRINWLLVCCSFVYLRL